MLSFFPLFLKELLFRFHEISKLELNKSIQSLHNFIHFIADAITGNSNGVVPVANVSGLLGRSARLPCDTTPPSPDNPLLLVIWFKEPSPDPIYRYPLHSLLHTSSEPGKSRLGTVAV